MAKDRNSESGKSDAQMSAQTRQTDDSEIATDPERKVTRDPSRLPMQESDTLAEVMAAAARFPSLEPDKLARALDAASTFSRRDASASRITAESSANQTQTKPAIGTVESPADIGRLVWAARKNMGLSQQRFADLAGVGRRFVSELENGKPTLEFGKVIKVCLSAGIDLYARTR